MRLQSLDSTAPPLVTEPGGGGISGAGSANAAAAAGASAASGTAGPAAQAQETQPAPPTPQQIHEAVSQANASLQKVASSLQFSIDPDTKETVIQLVDTSDHKVLRQVPSPEVLAIAKAIDKMQGLLIKQVA